MSLIAIARPQTETETAFICCVLHAYEIPFFVRGNGMAGLFPGLQIGAYNTRAVLVPISAADAAIVAIADARAANANGAVAGPPTPTAPPAIPAMETLRLLLEVLLFGWFVPRSDPVRPSDDGG